jgi:hypothetical protein
MTNNRSSSVAVDTLGATISYFAALGTQSEKLTGCVVYNKAVVRKKGRDNEWSAGNSRPV